MKQSMQKLAEGSGVSMTLTLDQTNRTSNFPTPTEGHVSRMIYTLWEKYGFRLLQQIRIDLDAIAANPDILSHIVQRAMAQETGQ